MDQAQWAYQSDVKKLDHKTWSRDRWLERHGELCRQAHLLGPDALKYMARSLFKRASDDRALICAALEVKRNSGRAMGPGDDTCLSELGLSEICGDCRFLRDELRDGAYKPGPTRQFKVQKYPSGHRTIQLADFDDRIVAKAAQLILDPLIDPTFLNGSFGFRPGLSRFHAMAKLRHDVHAGYTTAVAVDIRKAFDEVPHRDLLEILGNRIPADNFVEHVSTLLRLDSGKGIPQGNALSPIMLNVYADHRIDRPWSRKQPDWPLIRYADDIVVLTRSKAEGLDALKRLDRLVTSAGLSLKDASTEVVTDLCVGGAGFSWLGHRVELHNSAAAFLPRHDEADRLAFKLRHERRKDETESETRQRLHDWVYSRGPAYGHTTEEAFLGIVRRAMDLSGVTFATSDNKLLGFWELGYDQWQGVAQQYETVCDTVA